MTITKKTIAKDILKRLANNNIEFESGSYVDFCSITENMNDEQEQAFSNMDAKTALKFAPCKVCALGAITLALVDRKNTLKMKDLEKVARNYKHPFLKEYFSNKELEDIEVFFECKSIKTTYQDKQHQKFSSFLREFYYLSDEGRAEEIFTYISKYGDFIPEKFIKWCYDTRVVSESEVNRWAY